MEKNELINNINAAKALLNQCLEQLSSDDTGLQSKESMVHTSGQQKKMTLREIVRGRRFKNGQEQIAVIVGYHEKTLGSLINKDNIKAEWVRAKMTNKYNPNFLKRVKDELIRIHPDGICDLTQTGEDFFENFLKNESTTPTSQ